MVDSETVSPDTVLVLTLGQWLDVADMVWEKSRILPWQQRPPYYSLLACINLYMRLFATPKEDGSPVGDLGMLVGIPYTGIEGLGLELVAVGP